jgi:hypothetical protein
MAVMKEKATHASIRRLYSVAAQAGDDAPAKVARRLNISAQTINNWEARGISQNGSVKAQDVYGCSAVWLVSGKGAQMTGATGSAKSKPLPHSHGLRLDPEIVASAHKALHDMYALKERVYHEDDVARFLLLYEKYAMRKAGVSEAELLGAGLDDTEMPQGAASGRRDDGVPDAGTDKRAMAGRVRR